MTDDQDRAAFEAWARKHHANGAYFTPQMDLSRVLPSSFAVWQAATAAERERRKPMTDDELHDLVKGCGLDWHRGYVPLFEGDDTNRFAVLVREVESRCGIRSGE